MKKVTAFFLLLLIIVMVATNPNEQDFKDYLTNEIENRIDNGGDFEKILGALISRPLVSLINNTTKVENLFLFSIYIIDNEVIDAKFLGIFNHFILIEDNSNFDEIELDF